MTACGSSSSGETSAHAPNDSNCQYATYNQYNNSYAYNGQSLDCSNYQFNYDPNYNNVYNGNGFDFYWGFDTGFNPYTGGYYGGTGYTGYNYPTYNPYQANGDSVYSGAQDGDGCQIEDVATGAVLLGVITGVATNSWGYGLAGAAAGGALGCLITK